MALRKNHACSEGTSFCKAKTSVFFPFLFSPTFLFYSERITEIACTHFAQVQPVLK